MMTMSAVSAISPDPKFLNRQGAKDAKTRKAQRFIRRTRRCNLSSWSARRQEFFEESARENSTVKCLHALTRTAAPFREEARLTGRENILDVPDVCPIA
jgi:hypothetical protein